jgi:hypothetical protein
MPYYWHPLTEASGMLTMLGVKPELGRRVLAFIRLALCVLLVISACAVLFNPNPSLRQIGALVAFVALMVPFLVNSSIFLEDMIILGIGIRHDIKLVEVQNLILQEIQKNNKQVIDLVVSQAELLSRMTSAAIKKK